MVETALIDADGVTLSCNACGHNKSPQCFHKDKTARRGHAYYCKECANAKARAWIKKRENADKRNATVNISQKARKLWAIEYKGGKCNDCGGVYPPSVYDFHHLDGSTKEENPSYFIKLSRERAIPELDKCVLLCANCHRVRHHG